VEPSTLAPTKKKPAKWWFAVTLLSGALGSAVAIGAAGKGTYDVAPFKVELRAWPAALGKTELAIGQVQGLLPSHAEAGTHRAPMDFKATIVGLSAPAAPDDLRVGTSPEDFKKFLEENGKHAMVKFGIKLALLSLIGGALAGLGVSMGRWRRIAGGALAGLLALLVVGLMVQSTYDGKQFSKTRYTLDRRAGPSSIVPSL
jgi:hypothetical protein